MMILIVNVKQKCNIVLNKGNLLAQIFAITKLCQENITHLQRITEIYYQIQLKHNQKLKEWQDYLKYEKIYAY